MQIEVWFTAYTKEEIEDALFSMNMVDAKELFLSHRLKRSLAFSKVAARKLMNYLLNQTRSCLFKTMILCIGINASPALCADTKKANADTLHQRQFQTDIVPLLDNYCYSCHDKDIEESGLKLSGLDGKMDHVQKVTLWKKIHKMVSAQKMPPKDVDQLSQKDISILTSWIDQGFGLEKKRLQAIGHRHKIRRLTNREFNRSLLKLVGAESSLRDFPKEENIPQDSVSKNGFSNDVEANPLTKTHLKTFKKATILALQTFAPYIEKPVAPLHYFYNGENCYTSRATQDHVMDFVKNVAHPITEVEFRNRREIMKLKGNSFLGRPLNKAVWGPMLFPFKPGSLINYDNNLLLANAVAFPASQMHSRGRFQFRIRVRGKADAEGNFPQMRIRAGYFDVFANNFRTLDTVQLTAAETVYEFEGNIKDFPYLDSVPAETTYRDGNVPKLSAFVTNDWYNCLGAFFIVLVENASRHEQGLGLQPGHNRQSLGNIFVGSYSEIMERARTKTLANYYMQDYKLVEVFARNQKALAGKVPAFEIDWAELGLNDVPMYNSVFFESKERGANDTYAKQVIERFLQRATRGFSSPEDLQKFTQLYKELRAKNLSFEESIHEVLASILISPKHLFIGDFQLPQDKKSHSLLLAAKLSFWLWGEAPDEKLMAACEAGGLLNDTVMNAEVERLFKDERTKNFVDHLVSEMWHLDRFDQIPVNAKRYPLYDPELERDIKEQFQRTIHDAFGLNGKASILSLIQDDQLWLNRRLAKHYGIDLYKGNGGFVKVKLPQTSPYGGVLTQARIMKMNSDGSDSHPIRRGVWVMDRILFDPPPPPPKLSSLKEEGLIKAKTLRERIAEHAKTNSACLNCHLRIDPLGLSFENFDAVGSWRDSIMIENKTAKVDIKFTLEDGKKIDSLRDLKTYILKHRVDDFSRGFVESTMKYALGRNLDLLDNDSVEKVHQVFVQSNYDFKSLLKAIAISASFKGDQN